MVMERKIIGVVTAFFLMFLLAQGVRANGLNKSYFVSGLGLTGEYARSEDKNDGGAYLSYRGGFFYVFSLFFCADAGYRFSEKSVNGKVGASLMFIAVGIEGGFACAYRTREDDPIDRDRNWGPFAPGGYAGLSVAVPDRKYPVFISAGGIFYGKNHPKEFYAQATLLVNFSDN